MAEVLYYPANEDYELKCVDQSGLPITVSDQSFTILENFSDKVRFGKKALLQLTITVSNLRTTVITNGDGASVSPGIIQGTSEKVLTSGTFTKFCLADEKVTSAADIAASKVSNCSIPLVGSAGKSSVTDTLTVWIAKAGQDNVRCA